MVMESRKAAPALRARLLRSYVPLRRVPSGSVLSGTIPVLPGGHFFTHKFKFQNVQFAGSIGCRNHKGRYLCGRVEQRGKKESEIPNAGAGVSVCSELFPAAWG